MKNTIFFLACICCGWTFAQVGLTGPAQEPELISHRKPTDPYPNLYYMARPEGDYYILEYRHGISREPDIRSLEFYATPEELQQLYQFFKKGFISGGLAELQVGSKTISISPASASEGVPYLFVVIHSPIGARSNFFIHEKSIDRLFGKE